MQAEPFSNPDTALNFILAGNARVTLRSELTNMRYTYRVRATENTPGDERPTFFVELLRGRDNERDYVYIGMIKATRFFVTRASRHLKDAAFCKAFDYVYRHLRAGNLPPHAEVWHESACGRCGRPLTVPSSIATGLGPECSKRGMN